MSNDDVSKRKIAACNINSLGLAFQQGDEVIGCEFGISFETHTGIPGGPSILFDVAVGTTPEMTIRAAERALANKVVALAQRVVETGPDGLVALLHEMRREANIE